MVEHNIYHHIAFIGHMKLLAVPASFQLLINLSKCPECIYFYILGRLLRGILFRPQVRGDPPIVPVFTYAKISRDIGISDILYKEKLRRRRIFYKAMAK